MVLADCVRDWLAAAPISDWKVIDKALGVRLNRVYLMHARYGSLLNRQTKLGVFDADRLIFTNSYAQADVFHAANPNFFDLLGAFLEKHK